MERPPSDFSAFDPRAHGPADQSVPQQPQGAWSAPSPAPSAPRKGKKWPFVVGAIVVLVVVGAALGSTGGQLDAGGPASSDAAITSASTAAKVTTTSVRVTTTTTIPPPPPPSVYSGAGDDVITLDRPVGLKIVKFECPACSGNTVLKSDGFESLLVNEIGAYSGTRWMDIRDGSRTTTLTVNATGSWTVTVGGIDLAVMAEGPMSGTGTQCFS